MRSWSISEARANISQLFDEALKSGPQKIERREEAAVVVISEELWRSIEGDYADFADVILSAPIDDDILPLRNPARVLRDD